MTWNRFELIFCAVAMFLCLTVSDSLAAGEVVKIALNYPETGPYAKEGKDEWYGAELARREINAAGGILGREVVYRWSDSASNPNQTMQNLTRAIDQEKVQMVFGGSSSAVAIAAGRICKEKGVIFFGTLTYSTTTTGEEANRYVFRECYDSWMAAKALGDYLNQNFKNAKYFYITADYTWGWTTEASLRKFTGSEDKNAHPGVLTPFPSGFYDDALKKAEEAKADVLVLVLFGQEMANAIRSAAQMGLGPWRVSSAPCPGAIRCLISRCDHLLPVRRQPGAEHRHRFTFCAAWPGLWAGRRGGRRANSAWDSAP
jgi:branched-chain amino acid transport system substrate-binding protein